MSERENILANIDYHSQEIRLLEDRLKWHKERLAYWKSEMRGKSKKLNVRIPVIHSPPTDIDMWEEREDGSLYYEIWDVSGKENSVLAFGTAKPGEWHYK